VPTHYTGDERIRRALDAYIKLSRARKTIGMLTSRLLAEYNLTESQLGTLESLYYLGPMCQKDIGDKMLVTGGNITMVVKNLEKRGLVSRERHEDDRRQFIVRLTPEGQQLLDELFPRHVEYITELMSILMPEEMDQLGELCKMLGLQSRED
jgi:MarR family 2-MHQ and catechol resistance regulon transcriptional repressor